MQEERTLAVRGGALLSSATSFLRSSKVWRSYNVEEIPSTTDVARELLEKLPAPRSLIDLGCGTGRCLDTLSSLGAESLVGVDVNFEALRYGQSQRSIQHQAKFVAGDAARLPFADDTFDLVVAQAFLTVIPTLAERTEVVDEVRRVLRPGGYFYVGDFLQNSDSDYYSGRYKIGAQLIREYGTFPVKDKNGHLAYFAHHFADDELQGLLAGEGFQVITTQAQPAKTSSGRTVQGIALVAQLKV